MLFDSFNKKIVPKLQKDLLRNNIMATPRFVKVVVNMRISDAMEDKSVIDTASNDMAIITGQRPVVCRAKKAVSGFKLRQGDPIGLKVTLRGRRMYDLLERLLAVVLPRLRDFRGLSPKSFDQKGNYTIGLNEHTVFPEIDVDKVRKERGMEITMVVSTDSGDETKKLLKAIGFVFAKE